MTAAACGAVAYVLSLAVLSDGYVAGLVGAAVAFTLRGLAMTRGWSMPVYRARTGRPPANTGLGGE